MNLPTRLLLGAPALIAALAFAIPAAADVLPFPNGCDAGATGAGSPCDTGGPNNDQPGTCSRQECAEQATHCDAGDAAHCPMTTFLCGVCMPGGETASATSAATGDRSVGESTQQSSGKAGSSDAKSSSGGCSASGSRTDPMGGVFTLGLLALARGRRRRRR